MGDHHVLLLGDDMNVYSMGENTMCEWNCGLRHRRQLGVSNNSIEWSPKKLCQEWKHVIPSRGTEA